METPKVDFSIVFEKIEEVKIETVVLSDFEFQDFETMHESIQELKDIQEAMSEEEELMIFTTS